jgi:gamma-butyrobetaine dioxygenase
VPAPEAWSASTLPAPPRRRAEAVLEDDDVLCDMLNDLLRWGVCVVEQAPTEPAFLNELAARIGPVRDSNFGALWDVKA